MAATSTSVITMSVRTTYSDIAINEACTAVCIFQDLTNIYLSWSQVDSPSYTDFTSTMTSPIIWGPSISDHVHIYNASTCSSFPISLSLTTSHGLIMGPESGRGKYRGMHSISKSKTMSIVLTTDFNTWVVYVLTHPDSL